MIEIQGCMILICYMSLAYYVCVFTLKPIKIPHLLFVIADLASALPCFLKEFVMLREKICGFRHVQHVQVYASLRDEANFRS